jgi:hypothetical protein
MASSSTSSAWKDQFQHKWALHPTVVLVRKSDRGRDMRPALGRPPSQFISYSVYSYCSSVLGVKWLLHATDCSPSSSAKGKNEWSYTSTPCGMDSDCTLCLEVCQDHLLCGLMMTLNRVLHNLLEIIF